MWGRHVPLDLRGVKCVRGETWDIRLNYVHRLFKTFFPDFSTVLSIQPKTKKHKVQSEHSEPRPDTRAVLLIFGFKLFFLFSKKNLTANNFLDNIIYSETTESLLLFLLSFIINLIGAVYIQWPNAFLK